MRTTRQVFPVTGAAAFALALSTALGGCAGGAGSADPAGPAGNPNARTTASATRTAPAARLAAPASPTRTCTTADLRVAPAQHEVKQGLEIERFSVTTAAAAGCVLTGVPHLVPKGPLSAQETNATVDLAVSQQPVPDDVDLHTGTGAAVALPPGKAASFYLAWYSSSTVVCVQANGFGFDAPGDTAYTDLRAVAYAIGPLCDGIFYVSPLFSS